MNDKDVISKMLIIGAHFLIPLFFQISNIINFRPRCDCVPDAQRREGLTVFDKIKVNVTSLKVNSK